MKNILINISGKIDKCYLDALQEINSTAGSLGIPFFIIGASARDFILEHFYNVKSPRMTTDIDLGIKVESWNQYNDLKNLLLKPGNFTKTDVTHRVMYNKTLIDLVPFGKVAEKDFTICLPDEQKKVMSILGFEDAYRYSTIIRLQDDPVLDVKIPTLPGLVILKLISWNDCFPDRQKDAKDLLFILKNYEHAGTIDRLYDTESTLIEEEDFDVSNACIRLLGKDIARICDKHTFEFIGQIINKETEDNSEFNLITQMMDYNDDFDAILNIIRKLKEGIYEDKVYET